MTRCAIVFKDSFGNEVLILGRSYDGYPEGAGKALQEAFKHSREVSHVDREVWHEWCYTISPKSGRLWLVAENLGEPDAMGGRAIFRGFLEDFDPEALGADDE